MHTAIFSFKNTVDNFLTVDEADKDFRKYVKEFIDETFGPGSFELTDTQPREVEYDPDDGLLTVKLTLLDEKTIIMAHTTGMHMLENGAGNWIPVDL